MRWTIGIIASVLIIALTYAIYFNRYQMRARIWHWTHGDTAEVGTYIIEIPPDWFVRESAPRDIDLVDTGYASRRSFLSGTSSVSVFFNVQPSKIDLNSWRLAKRQDLVSKGMHSIEENTIDYNGETAVCIGGDLFQVMKIPLRGFISVDCQSNGALHLLFNGFQADLPTFYRVLARVHHAGSAQRSQ